MTIKTIVIEGHKGDVQITRTGTGAQATCNHLVICEVSREDDDGFGVYANALAVAGAIYGTDRKGQVAATNSMVHEVMRQIQVVAGM